MQKKINLLEHKDNKLDIYLNTIQKSANEMKRIINDILDLSKLESNEMELILDNYEIEEILQDLLETFKDAALEKKLHLKYIIEKNSPKNIFTDLTRINQILSNLISKSSGFSLRN